MAAQRRFVGNAAHQLKTPLTLLSTQATYELRTADAAERQETLQALQANTRQTSRLANQLLILARDEPGSRRQRHDLRSEEHTSELQSLMRISYAVFCLK